MNPAFLIPETITHANGESLPMDLNGARPDALLVTLGITHVIEQEGLLVSLHGSSDGVTWGCRAAGCFSPKILYRHFNHRARLDRASQCGFPPSAMESRALGTRRQNPQLHLLRLCRVRIARRPVAIVLIRMGTDPLYRIASTSRGAASASGRATSRPRLSLFPQPFTNKTAIFTCSFSYECPSSGAVAAIATSSPYSLSASVFLPSSRSAAEVTCSAVNPKCFMISSPGADAP